MSVRVCRPILFKNLCLVLVSGVLPLFGTTRLVCVWGQVSGPVCLATTAVMLTLGAVFSRLWKLEWARRQRAMEL